MLVFIAKRLPLQVHILNDQVCDILLNNMLIINILPGKGISYPGDSRKV